MAAASAGPSQVPTPLNVPHAPRPPPHLPPPSRSTSAPADPPRAAICRAAASASQSSASHHHVPAVRRTISCSARRECSARAGPCGFPISAAACSSTAQPRCHTRDGMQRADGYLVHCTDPPARPGPARPGPASGPGVGRGGGCWGVGDADHAGLVPDPPPPPCYHGAARRQAAGGSTVQRAVRPGLRGCRNGPRWVWPRRQLGLFRTGCSSGTYLNSLLCLHRSHVNICYYSQDLHVRQVHCCSGGILLVRRRFSLPLKPALWRPWFDSGSRQKLVGVLL